MASTPGQASSLARTEMIWRKTERLRTSSPYVLVGEAFKSRDASLPSSIRTGMHTPFAAGGELLCSRMGQTDRALEWAQGGSAVGSALMRLGSMTRCHRGCTGWRNSLGTTAGCSNSVPRRKVFTQSGLTASPREASRPRSCRGSRRWTGPRCEKSQSVRSTLGRIRTTGGWMLG